MESKFINLQFMLSQKLPNNNNFHKWMTLNYLGLSNKKLGKGKNINWNQKNNFYVKVKILLKQ